MIAAFTGMRVTELLNLSWGDIEARKIQVENGEFCDVTVIQARGKGILLVQHLLNPQQLFL